MHQFKHLYWGNREFLVTQIGLLIQQISDNYLMRIRAPSHLCNEWALNHIQLFHFPLDSPRLLRLPCMSLCGYVGLAEYPQRGFWQPHTHEPSSAHPSPGPWGAEVGHLWGGAWAVAQQPPLPCWSQALSHTVQGPEPNRKIRKRKQKFFFFLIKYSLVTH